jgi:glycosyltransferase involved in cell wall biosynthesis
VDAGRIHVVPNSCAPHYLHGAPVDPLLPPATVPRALCFSDDYPNKDLGMVPRVARRIADRPGGPRVEFVLTLPLGGEAERRILAQARALGVAGSIRNVGTVPLGQGPALYRSCDLLFHPAVLETFPATYPEAMAMGLPIVTSDLGFAHAICGEAACYFAPRDPGAAAEAIVSVLVDARLRTRLTAAGSRRLLALGGPTDKQERLLTLVDGFARRHGAGGSGGGVARRTLAAC